MNKRPRSPDSSESQDNILNRTISAKIDSPLRLSPPTSPSARLPRDPLSPDGLLSDPLSPSARLLSDPLSPDGLPSDPLSSPDGMVINREMFYDTQFKNNFIESRLSKIKDFMLKQDLTCVDELHITILRLIMLVVLGRKRIFLGAIGAHGKIPLTPVDSTKPIRQFQSFTLPADMQLKYISYSNPGEACFVGDLVIESYKKFIQISLSDINKFDLETLDHVFIPLLKSMSEFMCELLSTEENKHNYEEFHCLRNKEGYYRTTNVYPGDEMVNYSFQPDRSSGLFLFTPDFEPIDILHVLFNLGLFGKDETNRNVKLNHIIRFFADLYIEEIIFFDFSCSSF